MDPSETRLCYGKDVFERMNYLYQASRLVSKSSEVAASYYGNLMLSCAKKSVLRMEPDVKRTICKRCQSPLIPGETARVRLVSKPVKAVKWTCFGCKMTRRISTKTGHKIWTHEPEALVQLFDYTPKIDTASYSELSSSDVLLTEISSTGSIVAENKQKSVDSDVS